jgi:hypothetical protein
MKRRLFASLLIFLAAAPCAYAQLQWFSKDGTSYLLARSHAMVGMDTKDTCAVAMLNAPASCAWCDQFKRCQRQTPSVSSPFVAGERNEVSVKPPRGDATTRSTANHGAYFGPMSFRLTNLVTTTFENRGASMASNRGIADTSGEIFFRVPPGRAFEYEVTGSMQLAAGHGHVQLIGIPNTGADLSQGFSLNSNQVPKGVPAALQRKGLLTAGAYRLVWFLTEDQISRVGSSGASLDLQLRFGGGCNPQSDPLADPALGESFETIERAAQAASQQAWQLSLQEAKAGNQAEFGGAIYEIGPKDFRFVPPVKGAHQDAANETVLGCVLHHMTRPCPGHPVAVQGKDMDRAYKDATACQPVAPRIVATYHSHPPGNVGTYLSIHDINAAINDGHPVYMIGELSKGRVGIQKYAPEHGHPWVKPMGYRTYCGCVVDVAEGNAAAAQEENDWRRSAIKELPLSSN